jgi:myo-inositol-1(or 4)-monophosphatase
MKEETDQMEEMKKMPLLQKAMEFAAGKHDGQLRKGTTIPYFTHVMEAMEIVSRMTEDEEVRAAAVLHDTLEDTPATKEELVHFFGHRVADLVAAESEDKREDLPAEETWLIRKEETIEHLRKAGTEIRMIALGDKLSNVRAMTRDYERDGEKLWQKLNNKNPKDHGKYYCGLANAFRKDEVIRNTPAYREYADLCAALFHVERDRDGKMMVPEL